jgi:hypothetical protein
MVIRLSIAIGAAKIKSKKEKKVKMRKKKHLTRITVLAAVGMVASAINAGASIQMYLNGGGEFSSSVGLTAPDGNILAVNGYDIGVYNFTVQTVDSTISGLTGLKDGSTFNSVCLSPSGVVNFNTSYNFNYETFSGASGGLNPSGYWSNPYGIQNAAYLWNHYGGQSLTGDQGAGLALAMLEVLYNGGATYGSLDNSLTTFAPNFGTDNNAQTAYNADLKWFQDNAPTGEAAYQQTYGLFVPVTGSPAGQEFIFLSPNSAVPEPTTLISGALLLLPFGASTLRILRRNRAA